MSGMMGGMNGQMGMGIMIGGIMGIYPIFSIIGLAAGALVILGAVMLCSRPFEKDLWVHSSSLSQSSVSWVGWEDSW